MIINLSYLVVLVTHMVMVDMLGMLMDIKETIFIAIGAGEVGVMDTIVYLILMDLTHGKMP